jgi:hypothetical protein
MRHYLTSVLLLVAFALGATSARQQREIQTVHAAPAAEDGARPSSAGVVSVADVPFPVAFTPYGGVEPSIVFTRDGAHVIGIQGSYWGIKETFGWYVFKWYPGRETTARDLGMLTTGRGVLEVADRRLWAWGFEGNRLRIFQVVDFVAPDDAQNLFVP